MAPPSTPNRTKRERRDNIWRDSPIESRPAQSLPSQVTARCLGGEIRLQGYTAEQTCRLTNCTPHQLRYWDRMSLVKPSVQSTGGRPGVRRLYSFRDLVALRVVRSLLDNGMSLQRVRRAWEYLRRRGNMDSHLSDRTLVTNGVTIFEISSQDGEVLDALREGQLAFFAEIDQIAREVEEDVTRFELDRDQFLNFLRRVESDVSDELAASDGQLASTR